MNKQQKRKAPVVVVVAINEEREGKRALAIVVNNE
jgi:hypothetical protein